MKHEQRAPDPLIAACEQIDKLRDALGLYGKHRDDYRAERRGETGAVCGLVKYTSWEPGDDPPVCTCGLDAILKGTA